MGSPGWVRSTRLDLGLLVDRQHNGVGPADRHKDRPTTSRNLGGDLGSVGQLELAHPVRLQAMRAARCAAPKLTLDAGQLGHRLGRPVGVSPRRIIQVKRQPDRRPPARAAECAMGGLCSLEGHRPFLHEPFPANANRRLADAGRAYDLGRATPAASESAIRARQACFCGTVPIRHDSVKTDRLAGLCLSRCLFASRRLAPSKSQGNFPHQDSSGQILKPLGAAKKAGSCDRTNGVSPRPT